LRQRAPIGHDCDGAAQPYRIGRQHGRVTTVDELNQTAGDLYYYVIGRVFTPSRS